MDTSEFFKKLEAARQEYQTALHQHASVIYRRLFPLAGTGEAIRIVYHGGSTPGRPRDIIVHHFRGINVVAQEVGAEVGKSLSMDKIEIVA